MERDSITQAIIEAAIQVRTDLGPGLVESTYEVCLAYEPASRGLGLGYRLTSTQEQSSKAYNGWCYEQAP